jgi:hypothetical protein
MKDIEKILEYTIQEYQTLKSELLQKNNNRSNYLSFGISGIAIFIYGAGTTKCDFPLLTYLILLFFIPLLSCAIVIRMINVNFSIHLIRGYLIRKEGHIKRLILMRIPLSTDRIFAEKMLPFNWETDTDRQRKYKFVSKNLLAMISEVTKSEFWSSVLPFFLEAGTYSLFVTIAIVSLALANSFKEKAREIPKDCLVYDYDYAFPVLMWGMWGLTIIIIVVSVLYLLYRFPFLIFWNWCSKRTKKGADRNT